MTFENLSEYFDYHKGDKRVSRKIVAEAMNVSVSTLSKWVNGKGFASLEKAERMEQMFNIKKESVMKKTPWGYKKEGIFKRIIKRRIK